MCGTKLDGVCVYCSEHVCASCRAHKQALEGVTVAEDEVLDRMLVEAPEQPQILDVFLFWPVRAVIRLTKPKDSVDEDGTSDDVPKLKSL